MEKLLNYLITRLVDEPDKISIQSETKNGFVFLNLRVSPADLPRIIGKKGRVIKAIRQIIKISSYLKDQKTMVVLQE